MPDIPEIPQPAEQQLSKEAGLKFSGRTIANPDHPNRNDDAIGFSEQGGFAIVCDGMGGLPNGDKASRAARNFLGQRLAEIRPDIHPNVVLGMMQKGLIDASEAVTSDVPKAATTATMVKFLERDRQLRIIVGHVGDSKCYLLSGGQLIQLTEDERIADGTNQVTNYLGSKMKPTPKLYSRNIIEGDKLILASDGIEVLTQEEITQILQSTPQNPATALAKRAYAKSLQPGVRKDDISTIVVDIGKTEPAESTRVEQPSAKKSTEYQGLLKRIEGAVSKPLDPSTLREVVQTIIELSNSPELGYFDANDVQKKLEGLFSVASIKSAFWDPNMKTKFLEAWKGLRTMGKVGQILRYLQRFASSDPSFFDRRGVYSLVTGAIPETYSAESSEAAKIIEEFNKEYSGDYFNSLIGKLPNIDLAGGSGWKGIKSKYRGLNWQTLDFPKGVQTLPDGGRIYINAKPQMMDAVFYQLAQLMNNQHNVPFDAKMINHGAMDAEGLNRADKIVLYFDPKDQATILQIVREVYGKFGSRAFDKNIPRFACQLLDKSALSMRGISFGQEQPSAKLAELGPTQLRYAYTFNNLREAILDGLRDVISKPDFDEYFKAKLKDQYIDPTNPAFNLPPEKGQQLFPVIVTNSI